MLSRALWPLLWSLLPAALVWSVKPYLRRPAFTSETTKVVSYKFLVRNDETPGNSALRILV